MNAIIDDREITISKKIAENLQVTAQNCTIITERLYKTVEVILDKCAKELKEVEIETEKNIKAIKAILQTVKKWSEQKYDRL